MYLNLFLTFVGMTAALHFICTAIILPSNSPLSITMEIASGFAASVGVVVASYHSDLWRALMFCSVILLTLLIFALDKSYRGISIAHLQMNFAKTAQQKKN